MAQYRVNWGEAPGKDRGDPRLEQAPQEEVLTLTPGGWVPHPLLPSPSYSTPRGGAQHALRSSHSYPATCPTCTLHSSHNYPAACPTCTHISPAPVQTPHLSQESEEADDEIVCAAMVAAAADATMDGVGRVVDLLCVEKEALRDEDYRLLHECVANIGWGEQDSEPPSLRLYFRMRRHLSCQGDIVLYETSYSGP
ncbi:hypothetical protein O3P69_016658 [Scylla paramamosain]|uniref:Uncharacterized protein n=1 Tax=Scylla paramamosain TaxID=85552 RepID=A0AAW0SYQ0_SCYPA